MVFKKSKKTTYYDRDEINNTFTNDKQYLLCGPLLAKTLVIIYNLLFFVKILKEIFELNLNKIFYSKVSGILLILFGVWTLTSKNEFAELLSSILYLSSTYILITAGTVIIFTSLLGLVGAWLEKRKILLIVNFKTFFLNKI